MTGWLTLPQNPVTVGQGGHLSDHDSIATDLNVLQSSLMGNLPTGLGAIAQTIPRYSINAATASIGATSGTVYMAAIWLPAGTVIGHVNWLTGSTAAVTPTHWWLGIADSGGVQRAHTADQTNTAIGAGSLVTVALTAPYTVPTTGIYYLLLSVTAATNPTSTAFTTSGVNMSLLTPVMAGVSPSAAQSTPGTDGSSTYTVPTTASGVAYMFVS